MIDHNERIQLGMGNQHEIFESIRQYMGTQMNIPDVGKGICTALSIEWLNRLVVYEDPIEGLYHFNELGFNPEEYRRLFQKEEPDSAKEAKWDEELPDLKPMEEEEEEKEKENAKKARGSAAYLGQIARNYQSFAANWRAVQGEKADPQYVLPEFSEEGKKSPERVEIEFIKYSTYNKMKIEVCDWITDDKTLLDFFAMAGDTKGFPRYFLLDCVGKDDAHAVAVAYLKPDKVIVYDPNLGVYELPSIECLPHYLHIDYKFTEKFRVYRVVKSV